MVQDILIKLVAGTYVLAVRFKKIKQDRRIERAAARGDHRLEIKRGEAAKGGSDWSYIGDAPGTTQPSRRLLPLEQRQRPACRELKEHVHILDQLTLLESPRARERVPPQAQKELDLRRRLVLNSLT